ncbi:MAG TPA: proline dehydrogenase family protein [Acidobacteriaceae bacterium]
MLRSFFIALSTNRAFRTFSERSAIGRRVSRRFVAGMTVEEAVAVAEQLNAEGLDVSLDSLGESVLQVSQAEESAAIYHRLLDEIERRKLRANVSVKLTQMGMDIGGHGAGPALAERIVGEMVEHAAAINSFVRIDMEGSEYTEATVAMTERLFAKYPGAVGTVLQAYMYRTKDDVERLIAQGIRMRLCKGAYKEPAEIAYPQKVDVDANYVTLMQRLVTSGVFCGIATHDEVIIAKMKKFVQEHKVDKRAFEFQMLYGVRRDLQRQLVSEGYGVRVYVPFGTEWYPYFMRRLAERPANVLFLAKNFFKN